MEDAGQIQGLLGPRSVSLGLAAHPCSYLDGREAIDEGYLTLQLSPARYQRLMDLGFRRSGHIVYRPVCQGCQACQPLRVLVEEFKPSKSQRRVLKRNADVVLELGEPSLTPEKLSLYQRYLEFQHPGTRQDAGLETLRDWLYSSCTATLEACYRDRSGRLVGATILDLCPRALSSVYHFFEPQEAKRSLGVYSVLAEIEFCRAKGLPWYYLGFWVRGCPKMEYKSDYAPFELMVGGRWVRGED